MEKQSKENNDIEKVKVTSAEIIVNGCEDKPYYEIKYYKVYDEECHIGYGSYDLKTVFYFLKEYFEKV